MMPTQARRAKAEAAWAEHERKESEDRGGSEAPSGKDSGDRPRSSEDQRVEEAKANTRAFAAGLRTGEDWHPATVSWESFEEATSSLARVVNERDALRVELEQRSEAASPEGLVTADWIEWWFRQDSRRTNGVTEKQGEHVVTVFQLVALLRAHYTERPDEAERAMRAPADVQPSAAVSLSSGEVLWRLQNAIGKLTIGDMSKLAGLNEAYDIVFGLATRRDRESDPRAEERSKSGREDRSLGEVGAAGFAPAAPAGLPETPNACPGRVVVSDELLRCTNLKGRGHDGPCEFPTAPSSGAAHPVWCTLSLGHEGECWPLPKRVAALCEAATKYVKAGPGSGARKQTALIRAAENYVEALDAKAAPFTRPERGSK